MTNLLQQYFPMIQTRREILQEIESRKDMKNTFDSWTFEEQDEFLDYCTGTKGFKILYDSFFKEIMNPESTPERLEDFLSLLLHQAVKILSVLPNDSTRLTDESSLLITDIVVELADGSIANVEIQKIGYQFPGQRCACYSADLLLRQYKRIRSRKKKKFRYIDIKSVYTIVLFEQSPADFHSFPENYIHEFTQTSNTGLEMELLQKYLFIPLDIFRIHLHNKGIQNKLDAWLAFLCEDDPESIITLINTYPEFKPMYEQIYELCKGVENIMGLFSKELAILDRNTVYYMMDEMQEQINQLQAQAKEKDALVKEKNAEINKLLEEIATLKSQI